VADSEIKGVAEARAALQRYVAAVDVATGDAVDQVLSQTSRQTRVMLSLGWHAPRTPTGSRAGEPPWRISGALSRSMKTERARRTGAATWSGRVGPAGLPYPRIQELGGWAGRGHRTYLPARPYLKPAVRVVKPTVRRTFVVRYQRAAREALR